LYDGTVLTECGKNKIAPPKFKFSETGKEIRVGGFGGGRVWWGE